MQGPGVPRGPAGLQEKGLSLSWNQRELSLIEGGEAVDL